MVYSTCHHVTTYKPFEMYISWNGLSWVNEREWVKEQIKSGMNHRVGEGREREVVMRWENKRKRIKDVKITARECNGMCHTRWNANLMSVNKWVWVSEWVYACA